MAHTNRGKAVGSSLCRRLSIVFYELLILNFTELSKRFHIITLWFRIDVNYKLISESTDEWLHNTSKSFISTSFGARTLASNRLTHSYRQSSPPVSQLWPRIQIRTELLVLRNGVGTRLSEKGLDQCCPTPMLDRFGHYLFHYQYLPFNSIISQLNCDNCWIQLTAGGQRLENRVGLKRYKAYDIPAPQWGQCSLTQSYIVSVLVRLDFNLLDG